LDFNPKPLALPVVYIAHGSAVGCLREECFLFFPFSAVPHYPQNPLDFSPLSTYFINTYPAVLRVSYRLSGAALLNT